MRHPISPFTALLDFAPSAGDTNTMTEQTKIDVGVQVVGVASLLGNDPTRGGRDLSELVAKVMCNTFNILDEDYEDVMGFGVYGVPSLINHSCDPNCVALFRGRELVLRSILPLNPGEQVSISVLSSFSESVTVTIFGP